MIAAWGAFDRLPLTADGNIIYPGMPVFVCSPYSIEKAISKTVHHVESEDGKYSTSNNYWCVMNEDRVYNDEYWDDGNTVHVSRVFVNKESCL